MLDDKMHYDKERIGKIFLYMTADALIVNISLLFAISLWYDGSIPGSHNYFVPPQVWDAYKYEALIAPIICFIVFWIFRMYSNLWKYASIDEIFKIFISSIVAFILIYAFNVIVLNDDKNLFFPRRLLFTAWLLFFTMFTFSRFGYRAVKRFFIFIGHLASSKAGCKRVMVIGAGFSGYGVVRGLLNSKIRDKLPVIIVDKDKGKHNTNILGVRVICGQDNIEELAIKYEIDEIVISKTSATDKELKFIISQCTKTDCKIQIMPPLSEVSENPNTEPKLRSLNISDLLSRDEVILDVKNIKDYLSNKVILVTGAGGSIGSELCRQISKFEPKKLIIFDIYENNAYMLMNELKSKYKDELNVEIRIGSIRDLNCLDNLFNEMKPHVVFHAAAHKHVPLMETSPAEAVKNNVFGAYNTVKCADKHAAERFVLLSTDKAVNPTSVMGATKRITEIIMQSMALKSSTKFMAVRFGNVLGSNGSIVPLFMDQIESGGPVTVTHKDIERYFMTIPEASRLVLQAASLNKTGQIFVLDMGYPIKIDKLARNLIKLSGLKPDEDIEIKYTGLRPGEKLYEELIMDEEKDDMQITCHKKIFMTKPIEVNYKEFDKNLLLLQKAAKQNDNEEIGIYLKKLVPNYNSPSKKQVESGVLCTTMQKDA